MFLKDSTSPANLADTVKFLAGLTNGTKYFFRVSAIDSAGVESGQSCAVAATPSVLNASKEYLPDVNTALLVHFDDPAGYATVQDASNNAIIGTASSGATVTSSGRFGNARSFNGTGDAVVRFDANLFSVGSGDFTAELWEQTTYNGTQQQLLGIDQISRYWNIRLEAGVPSVQMVGSTGVVFAARTAVNEGKWHHLAAIRKSGLLTFTVDGAIEIVADVSTIGATDSSGRAMYIGSGSGLTAIVDEVRFSRIARSPQEFNLQLPPVNLKADTSGLTVNLTWQNSGGAVPLMRYKIYRGSDSTTVTLIDSSATTNRSNTVPSVGTYYYRVTAVDSTGFEGAKSYAAVARVGVTSLQAPVLAGPANGSAGVSTSTTLTWNAMSGATSYALQVSTDSTFASTFVSTNGIASTSKAIAGLTYWTKYYWRINATSGSSTSSWSAVWNFTTILGAPALASPSNGSTNVSTSPTLTWNASTGAASYRIQVSTDSTFSTTTYDASGITGTTQGVTGLLNHTRCFWRVDASNGGVTSGWSTVWNFTTVDLPPSAPSGLTVTAELPTHIRLSWARNSSNEDGFRIERRTVGAGAFGEIAVVGSGVTTYRDTGLAEWAIYVYRLRAYNTAGTSVYSDVDSTRTFDVTPPASPINVDVSPQAWTSINQFTVRWTNPVDASGIAKLFYRFDAQPTGQVPGDSVAVDSALLRVSVPSLGDHMVYLYLQDVAGNKNPATSVSAHLKFDNLPPTILHDSLSVATFNTSTPFDIGISATATDPFSGLKSLQLQYRCAGNPWSNGRVLNFALDGGTLMIPASFILAMSNCGVDYRILAADSAGNSGTTPTHSLSIYDVGTTIRADTNGNPITQYSASQLPKDAPQQYAYRMFSVPLQLDNPTPYDVLLVQSQLEPYDNTKWRFFRLNASEGYDEYPSFANDAVIKPGAGFFLILNSGATLKAGSGKIVKAEDLNKTGLQLNSGYNFVGNPFNFDVHIDSLSLSTNEPLQNRVWEYAGVGGTNNGWSPNPLFLKAWEGVLIKLSTPATLLFRVADRPSGAAVENPIALKSLGKSASSTKSRPWALRLIAEREDNHAVDSENLFGVDPQASDSVNLLDLYEPPMIGDKGLSVYSVSKTEPLTHDFREPGEDGYVWDLVVRTPDNGARVVLNLEGLDAVSTDVFLVDLDSKITYKPTQGNKLEVNSGNGGRRFRLIVGSIEFAEENSLGVDIVPKKFMLYQNYPNPFNPETMIRYAIPDADKTCHVSLKIYNILGNEIVTLVDGEQGAGYYEVKFDARKESSGTYFCRIQISGAGGVSSFTDVKKLVLIK